MHKLTQQLQHALFRADARAEPTIYGDTYKLTDNFGEGQFDHVESEPTGKFKNDPARTQEGSSSPSMSHNWRSWLGRKASC